MAKINNTEVLILDNKTLSTNLSNTKQKFNKPLHQCQICGAPALHSNFGAISCSPCKMFFKRNAKTGQNYFQCNFGGHCEINIYNRRICSSCRLAKCFASGMQIEMIRCSPPKKVNQSITTISNAILVRKNQLQQLPTLNLLEVGQSILTTNQWTLFSNLMQCYDEYSGLSLAERFISQQNILPLKLRFKSGPVIEFISLIFDKVQLLFEKNDDFISLSSHDRSILLHRQIKYITIISLSFIVEQSHLFEYSAFSKAIENLFEKILITSNKCAITLLCFDIQFLKLILAIISFSSFDYTIYENIPIENLINRKTILQIQDMYIKLAWQYLIYVYDDKQAIMCFSNLIRCILTVIDSVILIRDKKPFINMIDCVVQRIEQAFILNSK